MKPPKLGFRPRARIATVLPPSATVRGALAANVQLRSELTDGAAAFAVRESKEIDQALRVLADRLGGLATSRPEGDVDAETIVVRVTAVTSTDGQRERIALPGIELIARRDNDILATSQADPTGLAVLALGIREAVPIEVLARASDGTDVGKTRVTLSAAGSAALLFELPAHASLGPHIESGREFGEAIAEALGEIEALRKTLGPITDHYLETTKTAVARIDKTIAFLKNQPEN
jgi:hypothetical protein